MYLCGELAFPATSDHRLSGKRIREKRGASVLVTVVCHVNDTFNVYNRGQIEPE